MKKIGSLIKTLRKKRGMSGVDLGVEIGISQQQISRYEIGKSIMPVSTFLDILSVLKISPIDFFEKINTDFY